MEETAEKPVDSTSAIKPASIMRRRARWLTCFELRLSHPLRLVLLAAVVNGLLYFAVIPPWWHYDEPGQFEYSWLIVNRAHWPQANEHDESMRREMARSMERYGWYAHRNYTPDFSSSKPIWVGAPQTGGQPVYYFVASLPLRLMRGTDITLQYEVVRFLSLLLYLLTILVIWKAMGELVSKGHPLQWIVTAFIALLPSFTDTMTSVNDDVGAVVASSIFLWLSIRMVKRGISISRLIAWGISLALCYFTKSTAWFALLVAPMMLVLGLLRSRWTRWVWVATPIIILGAALYGLGGGGAASWYQSTPQASKLRVQAPRAVLGSYVLQLDYSGGRQAAQTGQVLSQDMVHSLRGKTLTFGAWIWATRSVVVQAPIVRFTTSSHSFAQQPNSLIQLQAKPIFYRTVIQVPDNANYAIIIPPYVALNGFKIRLYLDGIVLTEGAFPTDSPQFSNAAGSQGTWNGQPFHNLIDNGSAEQGAPQVRGPIDRAAARAFSRYGRLSAIFSLTAAWRGTGWYYRQTLWTMFRTSWASVAADKFNLPGVLPNDFLLALTGIGLLGAVYLLWRRRAGLRWDLIYVLGAAFVLAWAFSAIRGVSTLLSSYPSFPWGRYTFPAILPSALLICAGWMEWLELIAERYRLSRNTLALLPLGMMGLLSLYTLFNVEKYFHPSLAGREWFFWLAGVLLLALVVLWKRNQLRASFRQI